MTAKILIVDDLKFNIDLLEEHLQNDLYEIHRMKKFQETHPFPPAAIKS